MSDERQFDQSPKSADEKREELARSLVEAISKKDFDFARQLIGEAQIVAGEQVYELFEFCKYLGPEFQELALEVITDEELEDYVRYLGSLNNSNQQKF